MTTIPTDRIIAQRLCLVCARDGVERPVQEHGVEDSHFQLTLHEIENFKEIDPDRLERFDLTDHVPEEFIDDADLLRYAIDVGGVVKDINDMWLCPNTNTTEWVLYNEPREAILHAKMEQLWDGLQGESDGR